MSAPREPRWTRRLLQIFVHGDEREFLLGDLSEGFREVEQRSSEAKARRWYRRQVLATLVTRLGRRPAGLEAWTRELRLASRGIRREPGHALVTISTLALGVAGVVLVGALATTVLRPLPYPGSEDLVAVWETREGNRRWVAPANYLDWRASSRAFEGLAAHDVRGVSVSTGDRATREQVAVVSGNFFTVLGAQARLGRTFDPETNTTFAERVAVLSDAGWLRGFGRAPDVLGRTLRIDGQSYRILGVMPPGVAHPAPDLFAWLRSPTEAPDIPGFPGDLTGLRDAWYFQVTGRLAPGVSIEAARGEMASITRSLAERHPETNETSGVDLVPLLEQTVTGFGRILVALGLAVLLILTAASFNVMHLTLARAERRRAEAAVRVSLGASRADIRRGLLVEAWLLGGTGAALGIALAGRGLALGVELLGHAVPRAHELEIASGHVLLGVLLGLVVGTLLALVTMARTGPGADLRSSLSPTPPGRGVIAVQVAVSIAVATGTLLLSATFVGLGRVDLGFEPEGLTTFRVSIPDAGERSYAERVATYRSVADAVRAVPGVESVAIGSDAPTSMGVRAGVLVEGVEPAGDPPDAGWQPVEPGYFAALGVPLREGRRLSRADGLEAEDVAVVNETFVRSVLPDRRPVGALVTMGLDGHERPLRIVGVVADTRTRGPASPPGAVLFRPIDQTTRFDARSAFFAVRAGAGRAEVSAAVLEAARSAARGLPVYAEAREREILRPHRAPQATLLTIMAVFSACALSIGVVGVYGVGAHSVRRRRRELSVRMALGATSGRVTGEVLGSGMRTALLGVPPGLAMALGVARAVEPVLYGVSAMDIRAPTLITLGVLCLVAVTLAGPARIAARTDPAETIKQT